MSYFSLKILKTRVYFFSLFISSFISFIIYLSLHNFEIIYKFQTYFFISVILFSLVVSLLFFLFFRKIIFFFREIKLKKAGQELQKKILFIFSMISLAPTLVVAFFSIFIFDSVLNGWFNKKISTAISQSVKVANQYLDEHQKAMRGELLELANLLNVNSNKLSSDQRKFNKFLNLYTQKHNLSEAVIIDSIGNVLAYSEFVFEYTYTEIPQKYYNSAKNNQIIITKEENSSKMRAFMRLSQYIDAYLLITRFVDPRVLIAINNTSIAVSDYQSIELKQFDFKISFIVIFLTITILLLIISLLIGLNLANRLVDPISSLIRAAEEVGGGNLDYKITNNAITNTKINELKRLSEAFNTMISDLKSNRVDLEHANDQLDKRRKFSESVLSGVYSGVIGLDKDLRLNLPNLTAIKLLEISIDGDFGKPIIEIVPEFTNLINKLINSKKNIVEDEIYIIRKDKVLNLITRIVVQKTDNIVLGYVLTFDDVTSLIAAQKMGAWSDIARRIAHEIKNPLTPIRLAAERLINHVNNNTNLDKKVFKESLNMITRQVDDLHHLVDEFSSFARMPSPKLDLTNITRVIADYINPIMHSFENVSFEVDDIIDRALVMADEKQIRQACGNLIKNSYENITMNNIQNGKICICFNVEEKFITISIFDNGTGIENSNISKILEPYYTTKQNGSGLGLAITKKIIDDHNGSMLVKSTKSDKGTVILMKFHLVAEIKKKKNKKNVKK